MVKRIMEQNILINFPTNIGDALMGLPVLDGIRAGYSRSKITVIVSPRTKEIFLRNSFADEIIVYDKLWKAKQKMRFSLALKGRYDVIVDLKNSFLPIALGIKKRTPFFRGRLKNTHIKDSYLKIARRLIKKGQYAAGLDGEPCSNGVKSDFILTGEEKKKWDKLNLPRALFIACTSLSPFKNYPYDHLKKVVQELLSKNFPLIILGEEKDKVFYKDILISKGIVDLVGKTTIVDVSYLLKKYARLLLTVDTGILHLGSYLNLPIVALFGPTDIMRAGPWSEKSAVVKNNNMECSPCDTGMCEFDWKCMKIDPRRVIEAIEELWQTGQKEY